MGVSQTGGVRRDCFTGGGCGVGWRQCVPEFGEERQVEDGAVVGEVGWIKGGLFEDGGDGGKFVDRGNMTKG